MTNEDWKTQADRLAHAMREQKAKKKEATESAARVDPDFERLKVVTRELWALPASEQIEVLKGMGDLEGAASIEKHERERGKAPIPLIPVRSSGYAPSGGIQPARWQVWRFIATTELWQAVLLSLNIEPTDSIAAEARRKQDRHSRLPADYSDRLMVCQANIGTEGPIRPQGALWVGMLSDPGCRVRVADVAAVLLSADFTLPDEMRAMVAAVIQANPTPSAAAPAEVVAFDDVRAGDPEPPERLQAAAEPVPVVAAVAPGGQQATRALMTSEIAKAFDGILELSVEQWVAKLGDVNNHRWLSPARVTQGVAPKPSTWCPLKLAELVVERGATDAALNHLFLHKSQLKPWLRAWQDARRERNAFGQ